MLRCRPVCRGRFAHSPRLRTAHVLAMVTASPLASQSMPPRPLGPGSGRATDTFVNIRSIRELGDGRLLVTDQDGGGRLFVVNFENGTRVELSRRGAGPGEHHSLGRLVPAPAETTLVPDPALGRWLTLVGATLRATSGVDTRPVPMSSSVLLGGDNRGFLLFLQSWWPTGASPRGPDSSVLVRVNRATHAVDSIGRVATGEWHGVRAVEDGAAGSRHALLLLNPLRVGEQAMPFPDGWVAIARLDPYRVEWITPDGRRVAGRPIPVRQVPVDLAEQRAAIERSGLAPLVPDEYRRPEAYSGWPDLLPVVTRDALLPAPDGRVVVARMPTARASTITYDLVNRRGEVDQSIEVGSNQRLVGFGSHAVYLVTRNSDGEETLDRRRWP